MPKAKRTHTTPTRRAAAESRPPLPSILDLGRLAVAIGKATIPADESRFPSPEEKRALSLLWERKDTLERLLMALPPTSVADVLVQIGVGAGQLWHLKAQEHSPDEREKVLQRIRRALLGALPVLAAAAGVDLVEACEEDMVYASKSAFQTMPEATAAAAAGGDDALAGAPAGKVGVQHPATAAAPPEADAELIALCDQLAATDAEITAVSRIQDAAAGPAEEAAAEKAISAIYERRKDLFERIGVPTSLAGARAVARAALATASRHADGEVVCDGGADWLAFVAAEFLAGEAQS